MTAPASDQFHRTVVITAFDEPDKTDRCVAHLLDSGTGFGILVVDHGDDDWVTGSGDSERVRVVKASSELWWAGASNVGIEAAFEMGAQAVMLLNPDCVLDGRDAQRLFATSEASGSVVAPIQVDHLDGSIICAGAVPLLSLGFPTLFERHGTGGVADRFTIVCGGRGVVIPRRVTEEVGVLADAELPHYWADHDFFLRCRRHGIAVCVTPDVQVRVDRTRTSIAVGPADMPLTQMRTSLTQARSHRNTSSIQAFFRRNYPIRSLHWIGSTLYVTRYTVVWAIRRVTRLLLGRRTP